MDENVRCILCNVKLTLAAPRRWMPDSSDDPVAPGVSAQDSPTGQPLCLECLDAVMDDLMEDEANECPECRGL